MRHATHLLCAALFVIANAVGAQQPAPTPASDPIGENLFPPELVMQHQQEIGLTDAQRTYIIGEVQSTQRSAAETQWKLQREVETMATIVKQDTIDTDKMLAQLDRILALERDIKRLQLTLLARVKNRLTPDQRARLQSLRGG